MTKEVSGSSQRFSEETGLEYQNRWTGAVETFEGNEQIYNGNEPLNSASYLGGLVNSLEFEWEEKYATRTG